MKNMNTKRRYTLFVAFAAFTVMLAGCSNDEADTAAPEETSEPDEETVEDETADETETPETTNASVTVAPDVEGAYDEFMGATVEFYDGDVSALDGRATADVINVFNTQTNGRTIVGFRDSEVIDVEQDDDRAVITDCVADRRVAVVDGDEDTIAQLAERGRPGRGVWVTTTTTLEQRDGNWIVVEHDDPINAALSGENDPYADLGPGGFNDCVRLSAVDQAVEVHNDWITALYDMEATDNDPERVRPYVENDMYMASIAETQRRQNAGNVLTEREIDWEIVMTVVNPEFVNLVRCDTVTTFVATNSDGEVLNDDSGIERSVEVAINLQSDGGPRVVGQQRHEGTTCDQATERPYSYPQG